MNCHILLLHHHPLLRTAACVRYRMRCCSNIRYGTGYLREGVAKYGPPLGPCFTLSFHVGPTCVNRCGKVRCTGAPGAHWAALARAVDCDRTTGISGTAVGPDVGLACRSWKCKLAYLQYKESLPCIMGAYYPQERRARVPLGSDRP